jgi:hypothetical protein
MFEYSGFGGIPGIDDIRQNFEAAITWGPWEHNRSFVVPALLSGAARDTGNTEDTTVLRPGLLMGMLRSGGNFKFKEWLPISPVGAASDGDEYLAGVLLWDAKTQQLGTNKDRWFGYVLVGGNVKSSALIIPGETAAGIDGNANEYYVKSLLSSRFLLDDFYHEIPGAASMGGFRAIVHKTADYTVVEADHGTLFTNLGDAGAIVYTLPAIANTKGMRFMFYNAVDQNMTVASAAANGLITFNNAAASSVAFSTAGNKIGGSFEVIGIGSSKWIVRPSGANTVTVA